MRLTGMGKGWMVWVLALSALGSAGCMRGCTSSRPPIHLIPNMDAQPKYEPQEGSEFFYDGGAMRMPLEGTVARGEFYEESEIPMRTGRDAEGSFISNPLEVSQQLLERGAARYDIYCRPCHGEAGDGQGVLFNQGVPVTSYFDERLMAVPDGEIFETITLGKGLMQSYAYAVPAHDRWAIVAHVRRMQEGHRQRALEQQQLHQQLPGQQ